MAHATLEEVLQHLADCNDSYEDILWINLRSNLSEAKDMTVEEWLRDLAAEYGDLTRKVNKP
jgi:hypothetical protein